MPCEDTQKNNKKWELKIYYLENLDNNELKPKNYYCDDLEAAKKKKDELFENGVEVDIDKDNIEDGKTGIFYPARSIVKAEIRKMVREVNANIAKDVKVISKNGYEMSEYEGKIEEKIDKILEVTEEWEGIEYSIQKPNGQWDDLNREEFIEALKEMGVKLKFFKKKE